ncbi:MAG: 4-hydroxy-3-methylbut-2-enyl diphosphate reductase [Thermoguttaceae bacterium]|nr:4-hydroxy-3-methylbut-2-enyl diphosphate reductase [Thermoguttaceae bacterium]
MLIKLLFPRGFCAGVYRATSALNAALNKYGTPVYVYHEIVHNKWVVDYFQQKGAVFVNSLDDIPDGSVTLFSAHGVSPQIERQAQEKNLRYIDASCPLVQKVHREAKQFVQHGYSVLLIGHPHHDEVVGVQGEAPDKIFIVKSKESIDSLPLTAKDKVAYITQTTLSLDESATIIEYLKSRFPNIVGPAIKDICYATQNRQNAIKTAASKYNQNKKNVKAIVVGSANSSNSIRLKEIALQHGIPAVLIDSPSDINPDDFTGVDVVLLTAGASAHEYVVKQVTEYFQSTFNAQVEEERTCEENTVFPIPSMP